MAALPYIQLYPADYLADTAHLNAAQHGAYLLLIMNYWQTGAPLKDSNVRLANVARMSQQEWLETREMLEEFFDIKDGEWIHHRIERDLSGVYSKSKNASIAGKASAEARRIKRLTNVATNVQRKANHTDTDTDTDTKKDQKLLSPDKPDDGMFSKFWSVYPNKKAKGAAEKAWAKAKPDQLLFERIIQAVMKQRASEDWLKDGGKFIPHPASWLNAKRWDDEIKAITGLSKTSGFSGQRNYEEGLHDNGDDTFGF